MTNSNDTDKGVTLQDLLLDDAKRYEAELSKQFPDPNERFVELIHAHRTLKRIEATKELGQ